MLPAVQRLRFNVHSIDPTEALITMVVIDSRSGEVLVKHQEVVRTFTGTSFEPDLGTGESPAFQNVGEIQVVARIRVLGSKELRAVAWGGCLERFDVETGRTAHILPLTIGTGPHIQCGATTSNGTRSRTSSPGSRDQGLRHVARGQQVVVHITE